MNPQYLPINHNGKLAIASAWLPHYDKPVMVRNIWTTDHEWDMMYNEMTLDSSRPAWYGEQPWVLTSCMGGQIWFRTGESCDAQEEGERIKPPRKRKGSGKSYAYSEGKWQ